MLKKNGKNSILDSFLNNPVLHISEYERVNRINAGYSFCINRSINSRYCHKFR